MDKFFKLKENGTNVSTEFLAGLTTFFAMSYIIFVNPNILSKTGMPFQAVFLSTIIATVVSTLVMGLFAKRSLRISTKGWGWMRSLLLQLSSALDLLGKKH